jgi:hypothetical protein
MTTFWGAISGLLEKFMAALETGDTMWLSQNKKSQNRIRL